MKIAELKRVLDTGHTGEVFQTLYGSHKELQTQRYKELLDKYELVFGDGDVSIFSAPGRSEIGGNHTDHQHGRVLAAAVDLDAIAVVEKTDDNTITMISTGYEIQPVSLDSLDIIPSEKETSESLIRGISSRFQQLGYQIGGFKAYMQSDVIGGSGLSSSACFEVLVGTIINNLYNDSQISPVEIAQIGQYAENNYFMKPCGLMDQMACSVGGFVEIDFKDEVPMIEQISFNFASVDHVLCIVDTKGSHADLTSDYAAIPNEMRQVANYFNQSVLREVDENIFYDSIADLRKSMSDRAILRAIHFFEENSRVSDQALALKENRFEDFKHLVEASGHSSFEYLQNVYSPKDISEQNLSIALGISKHVLQDQGVARVHGGGLAGTIQAIVPNTLLDEFKMRLEGVFGKDSCYVLNIRPYGGVKVI